MGIYEYINDQKQGIYILKNQKQGIYILKNQKQGIYIFIIAQL